MLAFKAITIIVLALIFAAPVVAGPSEDADAAFQRGDFATAFRIYRSLAIKGDATAQGSLGFYYDAGMGTLQDFVEAVRWYQKAAEQGDDFAQYRLGVVYQVGRGVPQDFVRAHMWFNLVAAKNSSLRESAARNRDQLAEKMTPAQIAEAQRLAREWKPSN
jgi:TPR repeat protein